MTYNRDFTIGDFVKSGNIPVGNSKDEFGYEYKVTPLKVAIHNKITNPLFGESVTHLEIDDEAEGPFIVLRQESEGEDEIIRLDMEELEVIVKEARKLIKIYKENEED